LNWTIFDGFNISTTYKQLKELERQGATNTRIAIEDFIASLTAEYYNYIQQEIRLKNFRYAVSLSRERLRIGVLGLCGYSTSQQTYHEINKPFLHFLSFLARFVEIYE
jgi:hypothetical protein